MNKIGDTVPVVCVLYTLLYAEAVQCTLKSVKCVGFIIYAHTVFANIPL